VELLHDATSVCPSCSTALSTARLEGYMLLCCPKCYGMLIDRDRFVSVIDAVRAREERPVRVVLPRRQNPGDRVLHCPTCQQPMVSHIYAGPGNIVLDSCERCQLNWLDPGELRRIALAPDFPTRVSDL
jgi:Zn-finger nucleic acid-binding protein